MKNAIGTIVICLLCGCALLKRKVAVDRQATSSALKLAETEKLRKVTQHTRTDSSYMETSIALFPKGRFSYLLGKGFEGEADRVLVTERTAKVVQERKEKQLDRDRELAVSQQAEQEHTTKQVGTSRISFLWLGIIAAGTVLVVYAYQKFKLFNYYSLKQKDYGNYK